MAERVHPRDSPPPPAADAESRRNNWSQQQPPPGTYVIQVPKEQIYRYPPSAALLRRDSPPKPRRSSFCRCFCCTLSSLLSLLILLAIAAAVFYLVFRPELPKYSLDRISFSGFNLSSAGVSPAINVSLRADNPNDKIRIRYLTGSSVTVLYRDLNLCNGKLPAFHQPSNNVTVFPILLQGTRVVLGSSVKTALVREQKEQKVPLTVKLTAPVKIRAGAVKTWDITVKVTCDVMVNKLTAASKIVSKDCAVRVKLW